MDNVTSIGGYFSIGDNSALTSLSGLDNVISIGGSLIIGSYSEGNNLTSLTGLNNVTSIGGGLDIYGNNNLTNLTGLDNVTTIGGGLDISHNLALTSLTGLDNIDAGSINALSIVGNSSLSTCEVQSICNYLSSPNGTVDIYDNAGGCNNPPEVANACGTIFILPALW